MQQGLWCEFELDWSANRCLPDRCLQSCLQRAVGVPLWTTFQWVKKMIINHHVKVALSSHIADLSLWKSFFHWCFWTKASILPLSVYISQCFISFRLLSFLRFNLSLECGTVCLGARLNMLRIGITTQTLCESSWFTVMQTFLY